MVKQLFKLFHKEYRGLHEAAFILALSAFASQILALLRDRLFAHTLGTNQTLDVYYAAFKVPDFLFITLASFVSVTVLIPFLLKYLEGGNTEGAHRFVDSTMTAFLLCMIAMSGVAFLLMPYLARLIVPGFSPIATEQFISLSRILLLFLVGD